MSKIVLFCSLTFLIPFFLIGFGTAFSSIILVTRAYLLLLREPKRSVLPMLPSICLCYMYIDLPSRQRYNSNFIKQAQEEPRIAEYLDGKLRLECTFITTLQVSDADFWKFASETFNDFMSSLKVHASCCYKLPFHFLFVDSSNFVYM